MTHYFRQHIYNYSSLPLHWDLSKSLLCIKEINRSQKNEHSHTEEWEFFKDFIVILDSLNNERIKTPADFLSLRHAHILP